MFTADLDLNVHTIKARGECQEWGWLSTVGPRGPAGKEPQSRGALRRAQRRGFEGGLGLALAGLPQTGALGVGRCAACDRQGSLETETDSGREADSVTETQIWASIDVMGGGGCL